MLSCLAQFVFFTFLLCNQVRSQTGTSLGLSVYGLNSLIYAMSPTLKACLYSYFVYHIGLLGFILVDLLVFFFVSSEVKFSIVINFLQEKSFFSKLKINLEKKISTALFK